MPADDGLGFHDEENLRPAAPDAAQCGPKQQVKGVHLWARPFPLEDGDLLPRSEDRQCEIATATEANSDGDQDCRDEFVQELTVHTWQRPRSAVAQWPQSFDYRASWGFGYPLPL